MNRDNRPDRAPRATLRLQLHAGYTLDDARSDLPYFARLGVSHLYLSPLTRSRPGSMHGYDVIDHGVIDPERGGEAALRRLAEAAAERGIGILLDIVPNHMATSPDNAWWWDVLKHGQSSAHAAWFDIDWNAPTEPGRVLAPFLGQPYDEALSAGEIRLQFESERGFHIVAGGVPYPVAPGSLDEDGSQRQATLAAYDPSNGEGRQRLHELLERQHYRLAEWRSAAQTINWRRFFEESGLIGVRVEHDDVFEAVHGLVLRLYGEGVIDGLRIDHVDGLANPLAYCRRLKGAMQEAGKRLPADAAMQTPWIVIEKILAPGEVLDDRWAVSGTTGYDFAADVGALQHDAGGAPKLFQGWSQIAQDDRPAAAWLTEARSELLSRHFPAERNAMLNVLVRLGEGGPPGWTRGAIGRALDALLSHYPVYRSYVDTGARDPADQAWFDEAMQGALETVGATDDAAATDDPDATSDADATNDADTADDSTDNSVAEALLHQLDAWLGGQAPESDDAREAIRRFQQLTPPLAAKSLEDTVFYRYGCLLSRNEVGSDPAVFARSVEEFHESNLHRAHQMPLGLLATATHDHKRGEDVRARLAVLSEIPEKWLDTCREWLDRLVVGLPQGGADLAFRYMLLQTLVGAWPPELEAYDAEAVKKYLERVDAWAVKALREGKQVSSWFDPDTEYEQACKDLLFSMAPGCTHHDVLRDIEHFARDIEPAAIVNGFVQTALRLTCPGVPDLYQGCEYRDFSLVDPDNRRAVDFTKRAATLAQVKAGSDDSSHILGTGRWPADAWADGRAKQALVAELLRLRRDNSAAFAGSYRPLPAQGPAASHVVAFSRDDDIVVIAAVKCAAKTQTDDSGALVIPAEHWGDTVVSLPGAGPWRDVLRGTKANGAEAPLRVAQLLDGFPLAVLCRAQG